MTDHVVICSYRKQKKQYVICEYIFTPKYTHFFKKNNEVKFEKTLGHLSMLTLNHFLKKSTKNIFSPE